MSQSANFAIVRNHIGGILFAVIMGAAGPSETAERKSISLEELWQHRPANIFKMTENHKQSVCGPLLASLNKSVQRDSKPDAFPLLRNKFIIDRWQEQKFPWNRRPEAPQTALTWEAAYLDLDGDGSIDGLFRRRSMIRGNSFHSTWFVDAVSDQLKSKSRLDQSTARNVMFNNILSFRKFDPPPHHNRQFIEMVEIRRKPYVIIGRAFYWTLREQARFPRVQLLKRTSMGFERVCLFDGVVEIVRKH